MQERKNKPTEHQKNNKKAITTDLKFQLFFHQILGEFWVPFCTSFLIDFGVDFGTQNL